MLLDDLFSFSHFVENTHTHALFSFVLLFFFFFLFLSSSCSVLFFERSLEREIEKSGEEDQGRTREGRKGEIPADLPPQRSSRRRWVTGGASDDRGGGFSNTFWVPKQWKCNFWVIRILSVDF
jgi:hypothetical protein